MKVIFESRKFMYSQFEKKSIECISASKYFLSVPRMCIIRWITDLNVLIFI